MESSFLLSAVALGSVEVNLFANELNQCGQPKLACLAIVVVGYPKYQKFFQFRSIC
jgi:hypothetical protein